MFNESHLINQQFIESSNLGTWVWNVQTGEVEFNERWAEMIGYSLSELEPLTIETWKNLTHPDDLEITNKILNQHFEGTLDYYQCEIRMMHKYGYWVWVKDVGKVISWTDKGESLIMSGTHQDISNHKKSIEQLHKQNEFLETATLLSKKFILSQDLDKNIIEAFEKVAPYSDTSRIYIFRIDASKETMSNTHEWCSEGVTPEKDKLQNLPIEIFPWWTQKLKNYELIDVPDVSKMPAEAKAEQDILEMQGIKSILVLPIFTKNVFSGFIGFDNVKSTNAYSKYDIKVLQMLSDIISNALEKQERENAVNICYENLHNFFNLPIDFVFVLDENGNVIDVNDNVVNKLGYSKEELYNKSITYLHDPLEMQNAVKIVQQMFEGKLDYCNLPLISKSGKKIPVQTRVVKSMWNGKKAIIGISKDVSKLMESEEKFSKAFYDVPVLFGIIEKESEAFTEVNDTFCQSFGVKPEDVIGKEITKLIDISKDDITIFKEKLTKDRFVKNYEINISISIGSFTLLVSATYVLIQDKEHVLLSAIDITNQKKLITELKIAKEKAEESDHLKSSFLAAINHELRTPLNHILGFSDLIPDIVDDPQVKDFAGYINKSGKNLLAIIEDIFDLALLEHTEVYIRSEIVFVRDLYIELKQELQETLNTSRKGNLIKLEHKLDSSLVTAKINTDRYKVMQVMSNLIKNAIKFTNKGVIKLELKTCNKDCLTISIKDTGIGIPQDKQKIIFDFFRQVDDSHTRKFDGVGIGLAISKKIAQAIGGEILLTSEEGKGAEFNFIFPTHFGEDVKVLEKSNILTIPDLSTKTLLIVEDDLLSVDMLVKVLQPTNCKILKASNGEQAIEMFLKHQEIDLIFMDVKMPKLNGYEATIEIRKTNESIPIIALTAFTLVKENKKAFESGCTDIITKPVIKEILFNKLAKYV